jgi:hypothetical protein
MVRLHYFALKGGQFFSLQAAFGRRKGEVYIAAGSRSTKEFSHGSKDSTWRPLARLLRALSIPSTNSRLPTATLLDHSGRRAWRLAASAAAIHSACRAASSPTETSRASASAARSIHLRRSLRNFSRNY